MSFRAALQRHAPDSMGCTTYKYSFNKLPRRVHVPCAAKQQQQVHCLDGTPEACALEILSLWQDRNLEGLLPFMSEISVIKAVVRQHHARVEEQKQQDKLRQKKEQQQHQLQQQQQRHHQGLQSQWQPSIPAQEGSGDYSLMQGGGLATYSASDAAITSYEAQHAVPHLASAQPSRPSCPIPGIESPDYVDDYESFNYAHRYAFATPFPGEGGVSPPPPRAHMDGLRKQLHPAARVPDFLAVLDAAQSGDNAQHLLDSFAMRHLVLSRPANLEPLSGMRLESGTFLLRVRSTSLWGEKCVLTFTLKQRSEQEQKSMYSKHPHKEPWVLSRVCGEPLSSDRLEAISPEHTPEAIVAAQVQALRECDFDVAYALTSPVGRAVAGTRERFKAALQGDFRYQPVLMHDSATTVHRTHSNANTYLEVLDVTGHRGAGSSLFIWVATRQLEGLYKNCWMVEYVTPVKDPQVIKALQMGL